MAAKKKGSDKISDEELKKMFPDDRMTEPPLIDIFLDVCERELPGFKKRILKRGILTRRSIE